MTHIDKLYELFCECGGSFTTDSRTIKGGELFFALKGDNFDGNAYAEKALEAGAAYAVVGEDAECLKSSSLDSARLFPVKDTAVALRQLALYHRRRLDIPVIGLTGTNGKTTTKELVNAVLSAKFRTAATSGNFNNNIGVPLTVLSIPSGAEIAIVEMGASHPGDIKELVDICEPDFGLITNVGRAHLLGFGSFEGVKATKGELYDFIAGRRMECGDGTKKADKLIFVNADNADLVGRQGSEHEACGGIQRGQCACSSVRGRIFRSGAFCRYCCHRGLCPVKQPLTDAAHPKKCADCGCLQRQSFKYGCCPEQFCGF